MTPLEQILNAIPDTDLEKAITEVLAYRASGILPNGVLRRVSHRIHQEIGIPAHQAIDMVRDHCIVLAASKWLSSRAVVSALPRYELMCSLDGGGPPEEEERADGDWVRFEDAIRSRAD